MIFLKNEKIIKTTFINLYENNLLQISEGILFKFVLRKTVKLNLQ